MVTCIRSKYKSHVPGAGPWQDTSADSNQLYVVLLLYTIFDIMSTVAGAFYYRKICPPEGMGLGCALRGLDVLRFGDDDPTGVDVPVGKAAEAI